MAHARRRSQGSGSPDQDVQHTVSATIDHEPLHPDRVAALAYRRYEQRGYEHGRDMDDWLEAERELREGQDRSKD